MNETILKSFSPCVLFVNKTPKQLCVNTFGDVYACFSSSGFYGDSHHVSSHHRSAGSGGGSSSHYLDSDYHSGGSSSKASNYPHHSLSSSSSSSYNRSIAASMTARWVTYLINTHNRTLKAG